MKFDVAITSYRRPGIVKAAVESCLNQGPCLNKVIVVDDASGDNTAEVIFSIGDPRIVYAQRSENGGIAAARREAFALSNADWTISLDSDHELLPGAIEGMARLLTSTSESVDILGARYRWDTGGMTPIDIPEGIIGYRERIILSSRKNGIGTDYLCAISKRIRQAVRWEPLRAGLPDTLFQLDIAKIGNAVFTSDILAIQKSDGQYGWTRGSAQQRWARRCLDASDGMKALELILNRHEPSLRLWGRPMLARLYQQGAFYALICGERTQARKWLVNSIKAGGLSVHVMGLYILSLLPQRTMKNIYLLRG